MEDLKMKIVRPDKPERCSNCLYSEFANSKNLKEAKKLCQEHSMEQL